VTVQLSRRTKGRRCALRTASVAEELTVADLEEPRSKEHPLQLRFDFQTYWRVMANMTDDPTVSAADARERGNAGESKTTYK
jgi:hypothetical protein